ncbi:MAG: HAD family hydrolase [Oscillospiraceae bacterium]|nr:HAD family hydrolase [Oscillospiraceae bacterium]
MTAIFYDIDDTLYSRRDLLLEAAVETASVEKLTEDSFMKVFYEKSDINFPLVENGTITAFESNIWRYEETLKELCIPYSPGDGKKFAERYTYLQEHIRLSAKMISMFEELKKIKSFVPCILSNGESEHQWKKYNELGLSRWIDRRHVIISGDYAISKPDKRIFDIAAKNVDPLCNEIWIAGDSYKHDIEGAKKALWNTLWFNRGSKTVYAPAADIIVSDEESFCSACIEIADPDIKAY